MIATEEGKKREEEKEKKAIQKVKNGYEKHWTWTLS